MTRALALCFVVAMVTASPLAAQRVRLAIHSVGMTHTEVNEGLKSEGPGVGGSLIVRLGRFSLEGMAIRSRMKAVDADLQDFDLVQWDVRLGFWFSPVFALEVGGGRREIDPQFLAQDVGAVRVGFLSEYPLARIASIRARGAYLVNPQFNGGGSADLAVEVGLGVAIGTANGRFRVRFESQFQRIDRQVNNRNVPIQATYATFGLEVGLF